MDIALERGGSLHDNGGHRAERKGHKVRKAEEVVNLFGVMTPSCPMVDCAVTVFQCFTITPYVLPVSELLLSFCLGEVAPCAHHRRFQFDPFYPDST